MRTSSFCVVALLALGISTHRLHGQISVDREVLVLTPDSGRTMSLTLRNDGTANAAVSVQLEDWNVDARGQSHWQKAGVVAGSCGRRVSVSPAVLQLAPGKQQVVSVTIARAAQFNAECWSAAVIRTTYRIGSDSRKHGTKEVTTVVTKEHSKAITNDVTRASVEQTAAPDAPLTVPVYVTPTGLHADGELTDMYVKGDSLEVVFRNTGQLRTDIVGEIQVLAADSSVVTTVPLDSTTVLVGATRHFRVAMPKLPRGQYVLVALVDFGGDQLTAVQAALDIR